MKLLSLNIRGLRKQWKRKWVREIVKKEKVDFLAIQETKLSDISTQLVRPVWDSDDFDFLDVNVIDKTGGLLWLWNKSSFAMQQCVYGAGFALIQGKLLSTNKVIVFVNVYGPQSESEKKLLWKSLLKLKKKFHYPTCWIRDVNPCKSFVSRLSVSAFRYKEDRGGSEFNARVVSYHFSILLQNRSVDFGPKPFRVFNHWLLQENNGHAILDTWSTPVHETPDYSLKQKIKSLRAAFKSTCKSSGVGSEAKVCSLRRKRKMGIHPRKRDLFEDEVLERDVCLLNLISAKKDISSML